MRTLCRCCLCLALALATSGCGMLLGFFGKPKVEEVYPRLEGIDLDGVSLRFDLKVRNPYWFALRVPAMRCGVDVEGRELLKTESPLNVSLPARGLGRLSAPVRIAYADLWAAHRSLKGANEVAYTFRCVMACSLLGYKFGVPVAWSEKLPVAQRPSFSDVRFRVTEASLRKAAIEVEATVTNPNAFEMDIQGLGYVFRVGDVELGGFAASTAGTIGPGKTGQVRITGEIAVADTALKLLRGRQLGSASLCPTGTIKTPHGLIRLDPAREK